jgi:lactobin A/cerein 7B family class IIb bacteriocin
LDLNTINLEYQRFFAPTPGKGPILRDGMLGMRELSDDEILLVSGGFWHIVVGASQGAVGGGLGGFAAGLYQTGTLSGASMAGIGGMISGGVGGGFTAAVNGR